MRGGRGRGAGALAVAVALALGLVPGASSSRERDEAPAPPTPEAGGPQAAGRGAPAAEGEVPLDRLLRLPGGGEYSVERRAGLTRGEWRARFAQIREGIASQEQALAAARRDQERIAGTVDRWVPGPPGTKSNEAPLDYRLRLEVQRHREEKERLERELRALEVEANLASVPADWRE